MIALSSVDPVRVAAALAEGGSLALVPGASDDGGEPGDGTGAASPLRSALSAPELARRIVAIRRAARAHMADGGVHTLWLGLGMLTWSAGVEDAGSEPVLRRAPVALWPVALVKRDDGGVSLVEAPGVEPRRNLTLAEKLARDFGVALEAARGDAGAEDGAVSDAGGAELDVGALLDAAEAIAASRPGWRLERSAQLGIFSFAKVVMWNDLDARAAELVQSPIVAHLAGGGGGAFGQPARAAAAVAAPPRAVDAADVIAPLDADTSQLAAIAAAGAGASFVLQGPPGTGKSQTIANLVAHCASVGKTV